MPESELPDIGVDDLGRCPLVDEALKHRDRQGQTPELTQDRDVAGQIERGEDQDNTVSQGL